MRLLVENFELRKKLGEEEALRLIREAGFDGIDYSYYWSKDIVDLLGENYREYAKYVKGLLKKYYLGWKSENPRIFNYRDDSLTIFRKKLLTH